MKKITYSVYAGVVNVYVDGEWAAALGGGLFHSLEVLQAFTAGLMWGRNKEFDPIAEKKP